MYVPLGINFDDRIDSVQNLMINLNLWNELVHSHKVKI